MQYVTHYVPLFLHYILIDQFIDLLSISDYVGFYHILNYIWSD